MPIQINLLAEAQAAEELRRRDPVKRAALTGGLLVAAILAWASLLQARITLEKTKVSRIEAKMADLETEYGDVVQSQKSFNEARQNLTALERLSTDRYLSGNLLNALQKAYVKDVRVKKLKSSFTYSMTAATKPKTNAFNITPGKPATATEAITLQIEAVDYSTNPGDRVNEYKEVLASVQYLDDIFDGEEQGVRLTSLNPPVTDSSGRPSVLFKLECKYPETVR